jgi:hypothetical protein
MTVSSQENARRHAGRPLGALLRDFPWVHLGIGLFGNAAFVVGSVLFLFESLQTLAIWVFIVASTGMLIGSVGQLLVKVERARG